MKNLLHITTLAKEVEGTTSLSEGTSFTPMQIYEAPISSQTELSQSKKPDYLKSEQSSLQEKLIKGISGVITKVYSDTVEIKFSESTFILFPSQLFRDKTILKYGQPVKYQIMETSSGFRYQKFSKLDDSKSTPEKKEILKILTDIPSSD